MLLGSGMIRGRYYDADVLAAVVLVQISPIVYVVFL